MGIWAIISIVAATFMVMELVAWAMHKYVMHGPLWILHRDHHKNDHHSVLERNDTFFLVFALPSVILFFVGARQGLQTPWLWMGLGILIYGIAYFVVHEVFIHQRVRWLRHSKSAYFNALRRAHKVHHKRIEKEGAECFGMLWVPMKYFWQAKRQLKAQV